ncbi:hypothetical protein [Anaerococcus cruorum]
MNLEYKKGNIGNYLIFYYLEYMYRAIYNYFFTNDEGFLEKT